MPLELDAPTLAAIDAHATATYPDEGCGVVIATTAGLRVRTITNIQNRLHAEDPEKHPRAAATAYFMEPKELFEALREAEAPGNALAVFFHSHPEHDAYFSKEDRERAMAWDEPAYPETAYVVVSVRDGSVVDRRAYLWSEDARDFEEIAIGPSG